MSAWRRAFLGCILLCAGCSEPAGADELPGSTVSATAPRPSASAAAERPVVSAKNEASAAPLVSASAAPSAKKPRTIAFVGDISISMIVGAHLDGSLKPSAPLEPGYPFGKVQDRLRSYDLLVGNLECVITNRGQPTIKKPLKAPLDSGKRLLDAGFDVVSVANNHVQDMDDAGYADMMARLDADGLPYAGGNLVDKSRSPTVVKDIGGVRVAVIGHYDIHVDAALRDIKEARAKADVVIAFLHWGVEYSRDPTRLQRQWAHELIDNGADVVVGGHAHIVHRDEIYKGKVISYSLGNFVFSGMVKKGSRTGSVLELEVDESGVVGHGYRTITIDERGAPEWVGERTSEPVLDPPGERPLTALGKPIDFHALK